MTGRAETTLCLWTEYGGTVPDGWAGDAIYKVILKPTDEDEQVERSSAVAKHLSSRTKEAFCLQWPWMSSLLTQRHIQTKHLVFEYRGMGIHRENSFVM